jgi:tetrahydromethanopterin S-methyltransferase subunit G
VSFKKDIELLNNVYTYVISENNNSQAELPPEIKKGIEELAKLAVEGDEEAIKMLTNPQYAEQILNKAEKEKGDAPVTEAFERFRANIGSKFGGADSIERRYDLFLRDVNGHLWEIEKDSKLLNVEPKEVNKFISDIIDVEPKVDKQGKLLQKIGYGVGRAVGVGMFAAPFAIAATYLAPAIGLYGISAKVLGGALAGGGRTATILTNKQLSKSEKIMEILKAVTAGYAMTTGYQPDQPYEYTRSAAQAPTATVPDPSNEIIKDWPTLSKTVFGRMDLTGDVLRSASSVDETALQQIIATLKQQGLDWSQMSMRDKAKIFDPILKSALNK